MALRALIFILAVMTVAGCGRVGPLEPPPPRPGTAPAPQDGAAPKEDRNFLDKLI